MGSNRRCATTSPVAPANKNAGHGGDAPMGHDPPGGGASHRPQLTVEVQRLAELHLDRRHVQAARERNDERHGHEVRHDLPCPQQNRATRRQSCIISRRVERPAPRSESRRRPRSYETLTRAAAAVARVVASRGRQHPVGRPTSSIGTGSFGGTGARRPRLLLVVVSSRRRIARAAAHRYPWTAQGSLGRSIRRSVDPSIGRSFG